MTNTFILWTTKESRSVLALSKEGQAGLDGLPIPQGLLKEYLVANLEKRAGLKLALRVDKECPWEAILYSHSAALAAGYSEKEIYYSVVKRQLESAQPPPESP